MSSSASVMARRWAPVSWKGSSRAKPSGNSPGMGCRFSCFRPLFNAQQSQLQDEELLKGQPEPGGSDFLLIFWESGWSPRRSAGCTGDTSPAACPAGVVDAPGGRERACFAPPHRFCREESPAVAGYRLDAELLGLWQKLLGRASPAGAGCPSPCPEQVDLAPPAAWRGCTCC